MFSRAVPAAHRDPVSKVASRIGIFDSGIGGFSVLRALQRQQPHAQLLYVADQGHAPYGERSAASVIERAHRVADHLQREGAETIVVACNTATAAAIESLRTTYPLMAFVGIEPGIKPAVAATRNGRIGVMATALTLASERYRRLVAQHACDRVVISQACTGLAAAIEASARGYQRQLDFQIEHHLAPLQEAGVDTVVLGCTHYALVAERIQARLDLHVRLIDTAQAVANQALRHIGQTAEGSRSSMQPVRFWSTAIDEKMARRAARRWLRGDVELAGPTGL